MTPPPGNASRLIAPMSPRSPDEEHRAATPLELFFDLVFVVAVAQVAGGLHHGIAEAHAAEALLGYALAFFAIWWAWMNFTWFASAYDTDDVPYRLVVLVQLTGALILAAGVGPAFESLDFTIVAAGYVVMRAAMVTQWLRAARGDRERRTTALRYAAGITGLQIGWIGWLFVPEAGLLPGFAVLAVGELAVPVWAERARRTPWHAEHIIERYGLFTIIVLGETILAASIAIRTATEEEAITTGLLGIVAGGILTIFSLWWLYFVRPQHELRASFATPFAWGYGHLAIFGAAAAVGAGIGVSVDFETGHAAIGQVGAGAAVAVPVAIFLLCLWGLHMSPSRDGVAGVALVPLFAGLVLLTPWTAHPVLYTGLLTAALLAAKLVARHSSEAG